MRRGRKLTTGRHATREELVRAVWQWWRQPNVKQSHIARIERVSASTVAKILDAKRCNRCHRTMKGTTAYDGACPCGGLIEAADCIDGHFRDILQGKP